MLLPLHAYSLDCNDYIDLNVNMQIPAGKYKPPHDRDLEQYKHVLTYRFERRLGRLKPNNLLLDLGTGAGVAAQQIAAAGICRVKAINAQNMLKSKPPRNFEYMIGPVEAKLGEINECGDLIALCEVSNPRFGSHR